MNTAFSRLPGSATAFQQFGARAIEKACGRVRTTNAMGAACCGGTAYVEKPFSGIQSNGQYVVDGVVIPRREMSKEEAARRGLKEDDWRGSMWGRTSAYAVAPTLRACCLIIMLLGACAVAEFPQQSITVVDAVRCSTMHVELVFSH